MLLKIMFFFVYVHENDYHGYFVVQKLGSNGLTFDFEKTFKKSLFEKEFPKYKKKFIFIFIPHPPL